VLGLFIGWENRVTLGQKRVTIGFCNGQKFEEPPKSCHVWVKKFHDLSFSKISCLEILSRFRRRVTIWECRKDINFNLENFWMPKFVSRFQYRDTIWKCRKTTIFNLEKFWGASEERQNRVTFYPKRVTILPSIGLEIFCSSHCFSKKKFVFLIFLKAIKNKNTTCYEMVGCLP